MRTMRFRPMIWAAYAITLLLGVKFYMSSWQSNLGLNDHGQLANTISQSFQFLKNKEDGPKGIITGATSTPEKPASEKKKEPEASASEPKDSPKKEDPTSQNPEAAKTEAAKTESTNKSGADEAAISVPEMPDSEKILLQRLAARRASIEEREKALLEREALAAAAEQKLEARIAELKAADEELKTAVEQRKAGLQIGLLSLAVEQRKAEQTNLKPLVIMYETMKPKDAARIFEKLQLADLLPVAQAMNPRKLSEVLAQVDPAIAGKITVGLAPFLRSRNPEPSGLIPELPDLPVKTR